MFDKILFGTIASGRPYASSPSGDPFWSDVVLLLHFDGNKNDSGPLGLIPATAGNHTIDGSSVKFGSGSLNATDRYVNEMNYLRYTNSSLNLNSNAQWTVECWVMFPVSQSGQNNLASERSICNNEEFSGAPWPLIALGAGVTDPPRLQMRGGTYGSLTQMLNSTTPIPYGQWVHVAFVRDGSALRAYQDGLLVASGTYTAVTTANTTGIAWGPRGSSSAYNGSLTGHMDDFRMTLAVRYTSDFTPPTSAFPDF